MLMTNTFVCKVGYFKKRNTREKNINNKKIISKETITINHMHYSLVNKEEIANERSESREENQVYSHCFDVVLNAFPLDLTQVRFYLNEKS